MKNNSKSSLKWIVKCLLKSQKQINFIQISKKNILCACDFEVKPKTKSLNLISLQQFPLKFLILAKKKKIIIIIKT